MSASPLGAELLTVVTRVNRWATREAELEVLPGQARLLAQLDELGPSRIGDLARADHCSQPTMTGQVQRLEASGLATRRCDPDDARASLVELTPAGRSALEGVRAARSAAVAPLIDRLDTADRNALRAAIASLRRLLDAADELPGSDSPQHTGHPDHPDRPHHPQES